MHSNYGVTIAGYLAGEITGQTYEELITNAILTPLEMTRTTTNPNDTKRIGNFVQPFVASPDGSGAVQEVDVDVLVFNQLEAPAGGVFSSANDMAKWIQG